MAITVATITWWTVIGITLLVLSREAAAENTPLDIQFEGGDAAYYDGEAAELFVYGTILGVTYLGLAAYGAVRLAVTEPSRGAHSTAPGMTWLRGCCAILALRAFLFWFPSITGRAPISDDHHHLVLTTAPVLIDWLFVGQREVHIRWWHPPAWATVSMVGLGLGVSLYNNHLGFDSGFPLGDGDRPVDLLLGLSLWSLLAYLLYTFVMLPRLDRRWRAQGS